MENKFNAESLLLNMQLDILVTLSQLMIPEDLREKELIKKVFTNMSMYVEAMKKIGAIKVEMPAVEVTKEGEVQ